MGLLFGIPLLLLLFFALILVFEIWMFIDAIQNRGLSDSERALWCIGMVLIHPFVAIAYYFIGYSKRGGSN